MKTRLFAVLASSLGLLALSATAHATLTTSYSNSPTVLAYSADVLTTDLVNNGQTTFLSSSISAPPWGSFTKAGLNDGASSTSDISKSTFWNAGWPITITIDLNVSGAPGTSIYGYDITQIQTIGGWTGDFVDQRYTVWVKTVGSPGYVQLGGNFVDPTVVTSTTKSTKTVINDTTPGAPLATGVQSVQFVYSAPVKGTAGALVIQEIDVSGIATIPEPGAALLGGLGLLAFLRRRRA